MNYTNKHLRTRDLHMFVLDKLGLLSTTKEQEDIADGKETRALTKAQVIKAAFRVLTLKLAEQVYQCW